MPRPITEPYNACLAILRGSRDSSAELGAISKPTHDQNAPNSATPAAAAPNPLIAAELLKMSAGFSGEALKPSGPPPCRMTPAARTRQATTSDTSATPRIFAVSSMWNQAQGGISAREE